MDRQRRSQLLIVLVVAAALVGAAFIGSRWNGRIPDGVGSSVLARTVMSGENGTDGTRSPDGGPTLYGQDCREITDNPSGPMSVCWEAYREPNDGDPDKDYFHVSVYGSFGGESGTGVNWFVGRADLVDEPAGGSYAHWPYSTSSGACREMPVDIPLLSGSIPELVCGTTTGSLDATSWTQTVTWACEACPFGNHMTRGYSTYGFVGVAEGTVPAWDISIDYGS